MPYNGLVFWFYSRIMCLTCFNWCYTLFAEIRFLFTRWCCWSYQGIPNQLNPRLILICIFCSTKAIVFLGQCRITMQLLTGSMQIFFLKVGYNKMFYEFAHFRCTGRVRLMKFFYWHWFDMLFFLTNICFCVLMFSLFLLHSIFGNFPQKKISYIRIVGSCDKRQYNIIFEISFKTFEFWYG